MNYKEEYLQLVKIIKRGRMGDASHLRNEDLAELLGYDRSYFSTLIGDNGKITLKHVKQLKYLMAEMLYNQTITLNAEDLQLYDSIQLENIKSSINSTKKAPTVSDVDAFLISNQIRQEAILQTMLEFLAEIGAPQLKMPVTKVLSDLQKAVSNREAELTAATKKAVS